MTSLHVRPEALPGVETQRHLQVLLMSFGRLLICSTHMSTTRDLFFFLWSYCVNDVTLVLQSHHLVAAETCVVPSALRQVE